MRLHERLAAIRSARLDAVNKSILFVLAGYAADDEERPVWPSVVTIAADAGVNKDTVTARMTALAGLGLIVQTRKHGMGQNASYRVAWDLVSTCDARPARRSVIARQDPTGPDLVTASGVEQDPTGSDDKIRLDRISRSDGVGREDPTGSDITIHENRSEGTDQVNHPSARDDEPTPERPTMHPLSKTIADDIRRRHNIPTTDEVSDGQATLHHAQPAGLHRLPDAAGPVLPDAAPETALEVASTLSRCGACSDRGWSCDREQGHDGPHASTLSPAPATSETIRCSAPSDRGGMTCELPLGHDGSHECGPFVFADASIPIADRVRWHVEEIRRMREPLPDPDPPATSEASALTDTESGSLPVLFSAHPPAKPKRKAKTATTLDLDAWGRCCQAWDAIRGKPGAWKPEAGMGRQIAEGIGRVGAARMEARLASVAAGTSPAGRKIRAFFDAEGADLGMLCWERGAKLLTALDGEIEQATLDAEVRSEAVVTSGGMLAHPSAQNAQERQPAPKQNGSSAWDDMLSVIRSTGGLRLSLGLRGSTLSHEPTEHKRRCQAVADIGGWAKLCEMGEGNRGIIRAQWVAAYDRAGVTA